MLRGEIINSGQERLSAHGRRRRRIPDQGQEHQQVSGRRLPRPAQLRPRARSAGEGRLCAAGRGLPDHLRAARRPGKWVRDRPGAQGADHLYLATDPDREGEAISWHLLAALAERNAINGVAIGRVVFHEITKRAVLEAMRQPRDLHDGLIDAYQARRALDYLVGFTLSPVLWRKLHGARSAGRVQSVALRLICERENEIEAFRAQEYWTIQAAFTTPRDATSRPASPCSTASWTSSTSPRERPPARRRRDRGARFLVESVEKKQVQRHPAPPFAAALQQEAARKLGFTAERTMRTAQRLFEGVAWTARRSA